jgi:hypothetical protein
MPTLTSFALPLFFCGMDLEEGFAGLALPPRRATRTRRLDVDRTFVILIEAPQRSVSDYPSDHDTASGTSMSVEYNNHLKLKRRQWRPSRVRQFGCVNQKT